VNLEFEEGKIEANHAVNFYYAVTKAVIAAVRRQMKLTVVMTVRTWWYVRIDYVAKKNLCLVSLSDGRVVGSHGFLRELVMFLGEAKRERLSKDEADALNSMFTTTEDGSGKNKANEADATTANSLDLDSDDDEAPQEKEDDNEHMGKGSHGYGSEDSDDANDSSFEKDGDNKNRGEETGEEGPPNDANSPCDEHDESYKIVEDG